MLQTLSVFVFAFGQRRIFSSSRAKSLFKREWIGQHGILKRCVLNQHIVLEALDQPMLNVSLLLEEQDVPPADIDEVEEALLERVDMIIDGGVCGVESTSIIDLVGESPEILREGRGDIAPFVWS